MKSAVSRKCLWLNRACYSKLVLLSTLAWRKAHKNSRVPGWHISLSYVKMSSHFLIKESITNLLKRLSSTVKTLKTLQEEHVSHLANDSSPLLLSLAMKRGAKTSLEFMTLITAQLSYILRFCRYQQRPLKYCDIGSIILVYD